MIVDSFEQSFEMSSKNIHKKMSSVIEQLVKKFAQGGEMELKGKIVYLNAQYRKANFALSEEANFGVKGSVLSWKKDLEQADVATPFSYYSKNGEDKVSVVFKIPPGLLQELVEEYKTVESVTVELKYYQDYPAPGKCGAWLQLKAWK